MTDRTTALVCPDSDATAIARRGFELVQADPAAAEGLFAHVLDDPNAAAEARVVALWGRGRLAHDRGAIDAALITYTDAVTTAVDTDNVALAAEVRYSWAVCLQAAGRTDEALAQLAIAEPSLSGASLGRLHMQRGFLLSVLGERAQAVDAYDSALPLLIDGDDELAVTRLISNRGVMLLQMGEVARARADLLRSQDMAVRLGQHVLAAGALHNLAYLDGRRGQFPAALRGFAEAREHYAAVGSPGRYVGDLDIDECEVLIEAGLATEAAAMAARVVDAARANGNVVQLAEALMSLARSRLMIGDAVGAEHVALESADLFGQAGRTAWAARARYLAIVAVDRQPERRRSIVRQFVRLRDVAARLDSAGWESEAAEVRVLTGRYAIEAGRHDVARDVLRAAANARRHPLARVRAEAWYASALLADAAGDRRGVWRALSAGLRSLDVYRSTLGGFELRSRAAQLGDPIATLGLRLALDSGQPAAVLRWAERCRAASFGSVTPSAAEGDAGHAVPHAAEVPGAAGPGDDAGQNAPPADAARADSPLDDLRQARLQLTQAQGSDPELAATLTRRVADLEHAVTRRARHRAGPREATGTSAGRSGGSGRSSAVRNPFDPAALRRELGAAELVEFVEVDGQLHAVVVRARPWRLVPLGDASAVTVANDHLAFALRRLAMMPSGPSLARHERAVDHAAAQLDDLLFGPVRHVLHDGPLVVVPTGALHSLLWAALPTARRQHGITVAPSAGWWMRPSGSPRRRSVLLVSGPEVRHADDEVHALRRLHPRARVLSGPDATVRAVAAAMATATLVHIAAHGVFRSDNPMFSTLQLHDGALSVHDLEDLARVPETVVLSACSSGRSGVLPGDELLGTSAALMSLGVRALAAPLLPIADQAAVPVALALHRGLRQSQAMGASLARCMLQAERDGRPDVLAAASSFTCYGARTT